MTAYGAVISLENTIDYILSSSHINLVDASRNIIQLVYKELQPWQEILERLDSTRKSKSRKNVNALDGRIKDLIWEFEDSLESLLTHQILSQSRSSSIESEGERGDVLLFSIDLQSLQDDVASLIKTLKDMEKEYIYQLDNMPEDEEENESTIGCPGTNSKMFGLSNQFKQLKGYLEKEKFGKHVYALVGMAGTGKTTLAKQIFQDPEIVSLYEHRAWVTVGRKPQLHQVLRGILAQLYGTPLTQGDEEIGDSDDLKERLEGDEEIGDDMKERLEGDEEIGDYNTLKERLEGDEEIGDGLKERSEGDEEIGDGLKERLEGDEEIGDYDDLNERSEGDEEIGDGLKERLEGDEEIGDYDDLNERSEGDEEIGDGLKERSEGDENLGDYLVERLEGKKCFIVLDDVWERKVLNSLIDSIPHIKKEYIEIC